MALTEFLPIARVAINGTPLTGFLSSSLSSVRISDSAGFESDTVELRFVTGLFGGLELPEPGAEISVQIGYALGLRDMGLFVADEVEESGPPRVLRVFGRAKPNVATEGGLAALTAQKTRSWAAGTGLGVIVETMAGEAGLTPAVTASVASLDVGHLDQVAESDLSLLTRVAAERDLVVKPAGRSLFAGKRGESVTASGAAMPVVALARTDISRWTMTRRGGETTGSVVAGYRDIAGAADLEVAVGSGDPVRRLREVFADEARARAAAEAEFQRAGRAGEALEIELPGDPAIVAEGRLSLSGVSRPADGEWLVTSASHELSDGGFRTSARCERPG